MRDEQLQELLDQLHSTPAQVAETVDGLPLNAITIRPDSGDFSLLENVCHLRDIEVEGYSVRIRRILSEDNPKLADINGGKLAAERDYNNQNLSAALSAFTEARWQNLSVLKELSDEQFERTGELEGSGQVMLNRLLELMCDHDSDHVDEMRIARRRLLTSDET